jgi:hypothetical protein
MKERGQTSTQWMISLVPLAFGERTFEIAHTQECLSQLASKLTLFLLVKWMLFNTGIKILLLDWACATDVVDYICFLYYVYFWMFYCIRRGCCNRLLQSLTFLPVMNTHCESIDVTSTRTRHLDLPLQTLCINSKK